MIDVLRETCFSFSPRQKEMRYRYIPKENFYWVQSKQVQMKKLQINKKLIKQPPFELQRMLIT